MGKSFSMSVIAHRTGNTAFVHSSRLDEAVCCQPLEAWGSKRIVGREENGPNGGLAR